MIFFFSEISNENALVILILLTDLSSACAAAFEGSKGGENPILISGSGVVKNVAAGVK